MRYEVPCLIRLQNVSKTYNNGAKALIDVTLKIKNGEFVFLVGPSGAGKSTLTKLLYREEIPNRGQVILDGKNVVRMRPRDVPYLRRKSGMVFQDFRLLPRKTVAENVSFALEVGGASNKEIKRAVPAVLSMVGLAKKADVFPEHLSGGEQQRVCIARAIVNNPVLLIADEPTGNLDPETSEGIIRLLKDISTTGRAVIVATHNYTIIKRFPARTIKCENGKLVEVKDDEEIDLEIL